MKKDCGCAHQKCNNTPKDKMCPKHGMKDCTLKEEGLRNWFKGSSSKDGKGGWVNVVTGGTCASDEPGEGVPKCVSSSKRASMTKAERRSAAARKKRKDRGQQSKSGAAAPTYVSTDSPKKKMNEAMNLAQQAAIAINMKKKGIKPKEMKEESDAKGKGSGTKDACYYKVKSRYDVWPSAYASGALVKCRKAGAKNWGNKSESLSLDVTSEACWSGYEKKGMKTMFGKKYPNCVKKKTTSEACWSGYTAKGLKKKGDKLVPNCVKEVLENLIITESPKVIRSVGQTYSIILTYRAKTLNIKFFFPSQQRPTKQEVQIAIEKIYPGAILQYYAPTVNDPTGPFIVVDEAAAWQRKEGKNPEGGLNAKGIASYRKENPGSKLSMAVTTSPSKLKPGSKAANRRKSFCARMGGVDGPMKDEKGRPTRKALALKKWNC